MSDEKKKNWFTSLFSDKEWDADLSKVTGWILTIVGVIGFFLKIENFQWVIGAGVSLLATGKIKEG